MWGGENMKLQLSFFAGATGAWISYLFGGFTESLIALFVIMTIDFITGTLRAYTGGSNKSENGGLSSTVGLKGIAKKIVCILFVVIAVQIDLLLDTTYIKDGVCVALLVNELISIVENAGLMGITIPTPLKNAIDMLKNKGEE